MRYLDGVLNRRTLLNIDAYEKNKFVPKPFDYVGNGLFRNSMLKQLYDTKDTALKRAINMLEQPFLEILDTIKRASGMEDYMKQ